MPVQAVCECGKSYRLKDELAGKAVKCPACGAAIRVPEAAASQAAAPGNFAAAAPAASFGPPPAARQVPPPPPVSQFGGLPPVAGPVSPSAMFVPPPLPVPASPYASPQSDTSPFRPVAPPAFSGPLTPFARDKFLLRQKHLSLNQKYYIWDEQGQPILFVERPTHFMRSLLALFGALAAGAVVGVVLMIPGLALGNRMSNEVGAVLLFLGIVVGIAAVTATAVVLSPKRHVHFYLDDTKSQQVLQILQDKKFTPINATYTVLDVAGNPIAKLHKNYLYNFFRKRWYVYALDGSVNFMAMEDSIMLSLLRRLFGPMYGLLRTNFVIIRGQNSDDELGMFIRKFTLLDRYVLDLTGDPQRTFDRRVALALGLMLDTGERR